MLKLAVTSLAVAINNLHLLGPVLGPRVFAAIAYGLPLINVVLKIS